MCALSKYTFGCIYSAGANCVSFCPVDIDLFLASTDDDIFTLSIKDDWVCSMHKFVSSNMFMTILVTYILDQIKNQRRCGKSCGDVHFKGKSGEMFAACHWRWHWHVQVGNHWRPWRRLSRLYRVLLGSKNPVLLSVDDPLLALFNVL